MRHIIVCFVIGVCSATTSAVTVIENEYAKLVASDGSSYNQFGSSVSIDGDNAIVGAPTDSDNSAYAGSAYRFTHYAGTWSEQANLYASDNNDSDTLGVSVSVSGVTELVGACYAQGAVDPSTGAAYVFKGMIDADNDGIDDAVDNCSLYNPDQADCNGNGIGDVCDLDSGTSADGNVNNIPDECECLADVNFDGQVNVTDLLILIGAWGSCP